MPLPPVAVVRRYDTHRLVPSKRTDSVLVRISGTTCSGTVAYTQVNLKNPPRIYTEVAIAQYTGTLRLYRESVGALAEACVDAHMQADRCLTPIEVAPADPEVSPVLKAAADPEAPLSEAPASRGLVAFAQAVVTLVAHVTPVVRKRT